MRIERYKEYNLGSQRWCVSYAAPLTKHTHDTFHAQHRTYQRNRIGLETRENVVKYRLGENAHNSYDGGVGAGQAIN
jgi:hypothetical protein